MNTREIYFKAYMSTDIPIGRLYYTRKDKDGTILIGDNICISFRDDHEKNIKYLEKTELKEGFMFWNISPEGEKFYTLNNDVISEGLANMISHQK